jgi:GrpB-like predicted nucleotidyltransferase (UPF0157 family)
MTKVVLSPYQQSWAKDYTSECSNLLQALGHATEGGVLFRIEHIGSTSIPGLFARPTIDIMIDVFPFPLPEKKLLALQVLGYAYLDETNLAGRQFFKRGSDNVHLHILDLEAYHWQHFLVFRNYLRANAEAANRYAQLKLELAQTFSSDHGAYQAGKYALMQDINPIAHTWHVQETGFKPLFELAEELAGMKAPWHVSSGWALDLFTGSPSRYHDDLDITLERRHQLVLQTHLRERNWLLHYVAENGVYAFWEDNQRIPVSSHQIHARKGDAFIDILLEPDLTAFWHYRRNPAIARAKHKAFLQRDALGYLAPELVLLFKAKLQKGNPRPKDQQDFERVYPYLKHEQKTWLASAIKDEYAEHPWLDNLKPHL